MEAEEKKYRYSPKKKMKTLYFLIFTASEGRKVRG